MATWKRKKQPTSVEELNPKKKAKPSTKTDGVSTVNHEKKKPTKWQCEKIWDFEQNGGKFIVPQLSNALEFFEENGFVVIADVMDEKENEQGVNKLLRDIRHINQNKTEEKEVTDIHAVTNKSLPGWASNGIRLQFGISHGQFAYFSRLRPSVKTIFAAFHNCSEDELCCSCDSIAVTPHDGKHRDTLWLHADQSIFNEKNEKIAGFDFRSIQGCLYYTASTEHTVSFVCSPKSQTKYWSKLATNNCSKRKHWMVLDDMSEDLLPDMLQIKREIMDSAHRIHVDRNSILLWNSKVFHQNGDALVSRDASSTRAVKRVASFICMAPKEHRSAAAFKKALVYAVNGTTSTHWPQFMSAHMSKHPRFSKGNCYENMCDIKPALNPNVTETQFQSMVPSDLKDMAVKVYNCNETQPLTLDTVHNLNNTQLSKFKLSDLWNLVHPDVQALQPWMN